MSNEGAIKEGAEIVKGIVEAVPVYQDLLQPATKELGVALQTAIKTVHIALAPVSAMVWGYDKIKEFIENRVAQKLSKIQPDRIISPEVHIAGPIIEALRFCGYQEQLREMYANLLATAMDAEMARKAHPSFVEIIKQISPDEAILMKYICTVAAFPIIDVREEFISSPVGNWVLRNFSLAPQKAGCMIPGLGPNYVGNLMRLGLIEVRENYILKAVDDQDGDIYRELIESPIVAANAEKIKEKAEKKCAIEKSGGLITDLGVQFGEACIRDDLSIRTSLTE